VPPVVARALAEADVVLVSCYGAGTSAHPQLRHLLASRGGHRVVVWDPHPAGGDPVPGATLVTPNLAEAAGVTGGRDATGDQLAGRLVDLWQAAAVAVTTGTDGAWLATRAGEPLHVPTTAVGGDACGAGDRFAAAAATALARGEATIGEAVARAVAAATDFVATGGVSGYRARSARGALPPTPPAARTRRTAAEVVRQVRSDGGRLVATGGCFDGLHAGHVRCLQEARALGDGLVVLLNSDASVRRRKGAGRPVHPEEDRVALLEALACVDAVEVFDEDDPSLALDRLRPDVWVKGGDYESTDLTEAPLVRSWGGRVVLVPYLPGRSTTAFLQRSP
jgi:rfaE bifunctional protein nucleotidyltransferase chain/domain